MSIRVRASRRFRISIVLTAVVLAEQQPAAVRRTGPVDSFERAKQLAWLNNWAEASQVLERLRRSGRLELDQRNRILARAVEIRGNIESLSLPSAAQELDGLLTTNAARNDQTLRLQILAMKGDVEFQYDLAAAERTWNEVERLAAEIGHSGWEARAGGELGCIAFLNGQAFTALKKVSTSLIQAEVYNDVAEKMKRLTALGEGLAEFGRPADALRFFDRALALSAEQHDAYFPFTAYLGKARLLLERGSNEGRSMLVKGLADARRQNQRVRESRILIVLGDDAVRHSNTDDALKCFGTAVEVARSAGLGRIEAEAGSKLASVLVQRGGLDEAAKRARESVAAAEKSRDVYHLPLDLTALAEIEVSRGDFRTAGVSYDKAIELVRSLFEDLPNARHESTVVATMGRVFQDYFAFALDTLHNVDKAFEILESARARGLVDRIRLAQTATQTETEPRNPTMMRLVAALNRRLVDEPNSTYRQRLLDELWETEIRALRFGDPPREPEFISAKPSVTLNELQQRLHSDDVLIEYALGPSRSFALAITRREVVPYPLTGKKEIESAVSRQVQAIQEGKDARTEGRAVYSLLLKPVRMISENSRLIIVPDGKLNMAPLGAAVDPQGRYLIQSHILSFAPSATAYYLLSVPRPPAPRPIEVLGVGGASYSPLPRAADIKPGFGGLFSALAPPRFSKLIRSAAEVTDLTRDGGWDTRSLTGDFATESVLKRLPLSSFNVLHFALHSAIDRDFPDRSGLVLTSRSGDTEDDLLQAREIIGLKLNADLVTLSACDGAAGTPEGIAGTNSLVQAFLMAGARSVVASVWQADDTFTATLMRCFYTNLRGGHDKAEALTLAKRELLREWGPSAASKILGGISHRRRCARNNFGRMSMTQELDKSARATIIDNVVMTVDKKHYDPRFDSERWRSAVEAQRSGLIESNIGDFECALNELVRAFGTPDSGFFHESSRKKVPKGIAARFQYCQPNECAPAYTQSTDGGDVLISKLRDGVGWLKVTKFPGAVGIDIAKEIDRGIQELNGCNRLVIDLRGNAGGGLAFLRVMSYLTPERIPVGYSVTRARAETNYSKEALSAFDRIPSQKAALILLALRFGFRDDSVSIITEGLGRKPFQGRTVLLVDQSTMGAGERIAAFAQERQLAPVVGTRTAGRLICCSVYKISQGYYVRIPARAWYTWRGELLEGKGVLPDCTVHERESKDGDSELEGAIQTALAL